MSQKSPFFGLIFLKTATLCALDGINPFEGFQKEWQIDGFDKSYSPSFYQYVTVGIGIPLPIPELTFGHRQMTSHSFYEFLGGLKSVGVMSKIFAGASYYYYLNNDGYYLGAGANLDVGFFWKSPNYLGLSPHITFGKEFEDYFYQLDLAIFDYALIRPSLWSVLTFQYGFRF